MQKKRRFAKPALLLVALAALAAVISGCAFPKPGSLSVSQPGGIGTVRVHFLICDEPADLEKEADKCVPNEDGGQLQYLLGIAVPPGSAAPEQVTAAPLNGGAPIVFHRNAEVAAQIGKLGGVEELPAWPPAGTEGVGYLSDPYTAVVGPALEWSVDADFGQPVPADGGAFSGPFRAVLAWGVRGVAPAVPANRPVECISPEVKEPSESSAFCFPTGLEAQVGTSDLRIAAPKTTSVFVGGKAQLKYGLAFATTSAPTPSFAMKATSTLKGAKASLVNGTFVPGSLDPTTHRAPAANSTATVSVPAKAKPGTYDVTLTATAPQGGTVTATAKLKVTKPKLKLGAAKLNPAAGTATLKVKVPGAGTLKVAGKGVFKVKKSAKKAKSLTVTIKASGAAKAALLGTGSAKVKPKLTFKPKSGSSVSKTKPITLKLS